MSSLEKLVALGAYSCGGALMWKNKELGHFRNGDFTLSEDGKAILAQDITDVEVKQDKPARAKKAKVEAETAPAEPAADPVGSELDALLGD